MKRDWSLIVIFLIAVSCLRAQSVARGKVTDENGETVIGAIVSLKSNKASGVFTDLDGNYSIKVPEETAQTLVVSYIGYKITEYPIGPLKKDQVLVKDFTMVSENVLDEVVVEVKQVKANDYYMENIKKKVGEYNRLHFKRNHEKNR